MTVDQISILWNTVFISILIVVCLIFSMIHLKISRNYTTKTWLFTSIYFIAVCFFTIAIWYATIGFIV